MIKWFLHRYIRGFERRYGYDGAYMHEMADTSVTAFQRFARMQMTGGNWRGDAPRDAWFAAGIAGAAIGTAGAIATAPFRDSYAYDRRDYRGEGFACEPGTWFRGPDGRRHPCQ